MPLAPLSWLSQAPQLLCWLSDASLLCLTSAALPRARSPCRTARPMRLLVTRTSSTLMVVLALNRRSRDSCCQWSNHHHRPQQHACLKFQVEFLSRSSLQNLPDAAVALTSLISMGSCSYRHCVTVSILTMPCSSTAPADLVSVVRGREGFEAAWSTEHQCTKASVHPLPLCTLCCTRS